MTGKAKSIALVGVAASLVAVTLFMIVAAFLDNDAALVGASAMCFVAASMLLAFAVAVFNANTSLAGVDEGGAS
jgi:uncharacterized membrane protein